MMFSHAPRHAFVLKQVLLVWGVLQARACDENTQGFPHPDRVNLSFFHHWQLS